VRLIVLVIALIVPLAALASCGTSGTKAAPPPLTNVPWQWTVLTITTPATQTAVPNPADYTLAFKSGGQLQLKADCNTGSGTYKTNGSAMTITVGDMTKAPCPPGSLATMYLNGLAGVGAYEFVDGRLALEMKSGNAEMRFLDAQAVVPTTLP